MYSSNGTFYTQQHSISFGDLVSKTSGSTAYIEFKEIANTWTNWHLIPSSRPAVSHPPFATKYIEVPGYDGVIDLTEYLTGKAVLGSRQGSFSFYVANGFENWETIRQNMVSVLHGKKIKMTLQDDPAYYYEGRFTVGNWETGSEYSGISISYQLNPYKMKISSSGSNYPTLWDTFNFETDYDYDPIFYPYISANGTEKTFIIYGSDYSFVPTVSWLMGNVTVSFGGVTRTLNSNGSVTLGPSSNGANILRVSGTGAIKIHWNGGSL